jgi:xanthine dehydrogenase accessory factor
MKELLELFEARRLARQVPYAVATVLRVEGSSYRRPGARMLINVHGRVAGSVSGGCLERAVISQGQAALSTGRSELLSFDTTDQDDLAFGSSLGCQGRIWIGLEVLSAGENWPLESIVQNIREKREPAALVTRIATVDGVVAFQTTAVFADSNQEDAGRDAALRGEIGEVLCRRKTRFVGNDMSHASLVEWLGPPLSLLLFGGGLDVPPMVRLAKALGHEVTVIDRRPEFARAEAFPGADRVQLARPTEITHYLRPDARTAAVVMNHHYDTDRDVLGALLPLGLTYIAMLGPKRRTQQILGELQSEGHDTSAVEEALHAPAGLDIGAENPEQIALAILAEIQATMADRNGGKLRGRNAPIHADSFTRRELSCRVPA